MIQEAIKELPNSLFAERYVLGCIVFDPKALDDVIQILKPDHFYRDRHQRLYQVMVDIYNQRKEPDVDMILTELEVRNDPWGETNITYVSGLVETDTGQLVNYRKAAEYAEIIKKKWAQRELLKASGEIAEMAWEGDEDAIPQSEELIHAIAQDRSRNDEFELQDLADEYMANLVELNQQYEDGAVVGIPTGFKKLDRIIGGWRKKKYYIIAARPGKGKTAMAINFAYEAVEKGFNVLFFSLEMSREEIMQRLFSLVAEVDSLHLRDGNIDSREDYDGQTEWDKLMAAHEKFKKLPGKLIINENPRISDQAMRSSALSNMTRKGVDLIIIDYLQKMHAVPTPGMKIDRRLEVEQVSQNIQALAKELNAPVITLAQLNRGVEDRADKRPELSDLKEASGIEQDADMVSFIWEHPNQQQQNEGEFACSLLIEKHRNGLNRVEIPFFYKGKYTKFHERSEVQGR